MMQMREQLHCDWQKLSRHACKVHKCVIDKMLEKAVEWRGKCATGKYDALVVFYELVKMGVKTNLKSYCEWETQAVQPTVEMSTCYPTECDLE